MFEMEFLLSRGYVLEKYRKSHNCMLIIVGHSYGTMLGSKYTLTHPDKVAAYIGVGQFVDIESDIYSYEDALDKAKAKGDDTTTLEEAYRKYSQDMTLTNTEGVTEELKRTCQMEWVQRCNNIHNRAEEIVLHEMIYS